MTTMMRCVHFEFEGFFSSLPRRGSVSPLLCNCLHNRVCVFLFFCWPSIYIFCPLEAPLRTSSSPQLPLLSFQLAHFSSVTARPLNFYQGCLFLARSSFPLPLSFPSLFPILYFFYRNLSLSLISSFSSHPHFSSLCCSLHFLSMTEFQVTVNSSKLLPICISLLLCCLFVHLKDYNPASEKQRDVKMFSETSPFF